MAAKSGGYHFGGDGRRWVNSRDGSELCAALSAYVSLHAVEPVNLATVAAFRWRATRASSPH